MAICGLDEWASTRTQTLDLSTLKGASIGIHAKYYLDLHLNHYVTKEPLLIALGGFPFALRANIEREIRALKAMGIRLVFVFDGLKPGKPDHDLSAQTQNVRALEQAWEYYDQQQAAQVVDAFSSSGSANPEDLYAFLQRILVSEKVDFLVAPYSASPQLAYLENRPNKFIDISFGPSDIFLWEVDKIITRIDVDHSQFYYISKSLCQEDLGRLSNEQFVDLCLLLGSPYLRTFPAFETQGYVGKRVNIREAMNIFNSGGRNAITLCTNFDEDQRVHDLQYLDRFKRAFAIVKHHIVLHMDGTVGPLDVENSSSDIHELIGQRLPEELYFYMSQGMIGPRIPNWLTSGDVMLSLPLGAEDTDIYRRLVTEKLHPIRTQTLCLLSNSLHRFYQTKTINVTTWYESKLDSINLKNSPSIKDKIRSWRVLNGLREVTSNAMWKFLQLRGYIDAKHQLTSWGKALESALSILDPAEKLEEPVFLAVELLRLEVLNSKDFFPNVSGGPMRGSDEEKQFNLLVSRVACLGKIQHKPIGYSGPLSRQLLSFRSLVSAVRSTLRDQIEVILVTMFLNGEVNRARDDYTELFQSLPFIDDNDCGLAIAVRTYLDDLPHQPEQVTQALRDEVKTRGKQWFQHSQSFSDNLHMAFHIWDAVYKATQAASSEAAVDTKMWDTTNKWLSERR
ncbi:hypothetical protein FQN57_004305 [Myotisia sp. PD_48]|nr:hypothetical protein FQN57_004305 [Myotisia sp. PD_48]